MRCEGVACGAPPGAAMAPPVLLTVLLKTERISVVINSRQAFLALKMLIISSEVLKY
jgi:hypothetical protein